VNCGADGEGELKPVDVALRLTGMPEPEGTKVLVPFLCETVLVMVVYCVVVVSTVVVVVGSGSPGASLCGLLVKMEG